MGIDAYVKEKQPLVYRTFSHALNKDRLAHAYLLSGEEGVPLKETAIYLAKSILCDHPTPFADLVCRTCRRIDEGQYPDFLLVDGSETSIKKEDVGNVVASFQKTSIEKKGIMVYVIHEVENMTIEAINSILKFLEEPSPNTYALLTTRNESKVLPTIVSRCETIRMRLAPREEIVKEALSAGVEELDAELLSFFSNNVEAIVSIAKDDDYLTCKNAFLSFLDFASRGKDFARYSMEKDVIPVVNSKVSARRFFDFMALALKDLSAMEKGGNPALPALRGTLSPLLESFPRIDEALLQTMTLRGEIEANINIGLILNHLVRVYFKE